MDEKIYTYNLIGKTLDYIWVQIPFIHRTHSCEIEDKAEDLQRDIENIMEKIEMGIANGLES